MQALATRFFQAAFTAAVPFLLAACPSTQGLQPFTTDGCSLFPDRALISTSDWCGCCLAHDLAYWRGGTAQERLQADQDLKSCVLAASASPELADLMFLGVRTGGGPYFLTPYRWGYGWPLGRSYGPLSLSEDAQAAALRAQHASTNPALALVCTKESQ